MKKKNMNKGQRTLDPTQDKCDPGCNVISAGAAVPRKPQRIVPWPQDRKGACVHCETLQFSLLDFLWVFFPLNNHFCFSEKFYDSSSSILSMFERVRPLWSGMILTAIRNMARVATA